MEYRRRPRRQNAPPYSGTTRNGTLASAAAASQLLATTTEDKRVAPFQARTTVLLRAFAAAAISIWLVSCFGASECSPARSADANLLRVTADQLANTVGDRWS